MIEVYSVIAPESAPGSGILLAIAVMIGIGLLVFFIVNMIKSIIDRSVLGIIMGIATAGFAIFWICALTLGLRSSDQAYSKLEQVWESGSYSVESGAPEELDVYKNPRSTFDEGCEISFWLNGKYFDTTYGFGGDIISESEWAIIKNSKEFEVKYTMDKEGNNAIFTLSVEKPDAFAEAQPPEADIPMTEIYNCAQQGFAQGNLVFAVMGILLVVGGAANLIYLVRLFFKDTQKFMKKYGVIKIIIILIVCPAFVFFWIPSNVQGIRSHYDYPKLLEENAYKVEIGKIEDLQVYEINKEGRVGIEADGDDDSYDFPRGCEIVFYLNGKFFDSGYAYGENVFSYEDIKLLRNSETVEVKYIKEKGEKVILSMSVSDNDSAGV